MNEDLYQSLKSRVNGEVRFDRASRLMYSTDASIYEIEPIGVVIPRTHDDVFATMEIARDFKVPVLPRGAGTSLAGQTVGDAVVIDMSKYLNRVLEVNTEERWAIVEPGVVQEQLNLHLRPMGFLFGPDTSTANRATLGGMMGNNSAGSHSIVYGKTIDHILEMDVVLSSGEGRTLREMKCEEAAARGGLEARIAELVRDNRGEIERRYPKIMRSFETESSISSNSSSAPKARSPQCIRQRSELNRGPRQQHFALCISQTLSGLSARATSSCRSNPPQSS